MLTMDTACFLLWFITASVIGFMEDRLHSCVHGVQLPFIKVLYGAVTTMHCLGDRFVIRVCKSFMQVALSSLVYVLKQVYKVYNVFVAVIRFDKLILTLQCVSMRPNPMNQLINNYFKK